MRLIVMDGGGSSRCRAWHLHRRREAHVLTVSCELAHFCGRAARQGEGQVYGRHRLQRVVATGVVAGGRIPMTVDRHGATGSDGGSGAMEGSARWLVVQVRSNAGRARRTARGARRAAACDEKHEGRESDGNRTKGLRSHGRSTDLDTRRLPHHEDVMACTAAAHLQERTYRAAPSIPQVRPGSLPLIHD